MDLDKGLRGANGAQKRAYLRARFSQRHGDNYLHWHVFYEPLIVDIAHCLAMSMEQPPIVYGKNMLTVLRK